MLRYLSSQPVYLTDEPVILHNVPLIGDVNIMRMLIESLGVEINTLDPHTWRVQAKEVRPADLDPDLCRRVRTSILLAGPMTARTGELHLPPPGRRCDRQAAAGYPFDCAAQTGRAGRL